MYWVTAECGLSILAICLPALFQLSKRVYRFGPRSLFSSRDFSSINNGGVVNQRGMRKPRSDRSCYGGPSELHIKSTRQMIVPYDSTGSLMPAHDPWHIPLERIYARRDDRVTANIRYGGV